MSSPPPRDLQLQCRCGTVRAIAHGVTPQMGNHCVCYCDDCQAFPKALGRPDVVDANGGTDIFQLSQARLEFTHGLDRVAWLRLTPKGTARWYTSCCNTPIGNTLPTPGELGGDLDKITVLSIAPTIASAVREVFEDGSVTSLFDEQ